jgi:hypothetical protein
MSMARNVEVRCRCGAVICVLTVPAGVAVRVSRERCPDRRCARNVLQTISY